MKMIKKFFIMLCFVLCVSNCATITNTNIPSVSPDYESVNLPKESRKDITFSVSVYNSETQSSIDNKYVAEKIKSKLKKSKLFNKISWVDQNEAGTDNHYHFDVKLTSANPGARMGIVLLGTLTVGCIPIWVTIHADVTMTVSENNQEKFAISVPATMADVFWIPLIIFSPFANRMTANSLLMNESMDYFLNEIITNKLY